MTTLPTGNGAATARAGGGAVPATVLLVGSVLLAMFFWPGHMDADALNQIHEARSGKFNDWWSPVLDWLWRGLFLLHVSPGFVLWATIAIFLFSLYALLRLALGRPSAVAGALLISVFPPVLGFLGSLQRDTWFGASTLAAYALVVRAQRTSGRTRAVAAVGSLIAIWVSIAARQNALVAVLPAALVATTLLIGGPMRMSGWRPDPARPGPPSRTWGARLVSIAMTAVLLGAFVLSQRVLTYDVIHAERTYPQQETLEGDLANISARTGTVLLPASVFPSQSLHTLRLYHSPYTIQPLISGPGHPIVATDPGQAILALSKTEEGELRHNWLKAVETHPAAYLHARWEQWTRLIAWSGDSREPYHPGYDVNPWGYKALFPSLDRFTQAYLSAFTSGPLMGGELQRVWVYLLVSVAVAVDLLRRRRPRHLHLVGWLCSASVAYYATFFFLSMGQSYRWAWLLVTTTLIGLCLDGADRIERAIEARVSTRMAPQAEPVSFTSSLQTANS